MHSDALKSAENLMKFLLRQVKAHSFQTAYHVYGLHDAFFFTLNIDYITVKKIFFLIMLMLKVQELPMGKGSCFYFILADYVLRNCPLQRDHHITCIKNLGKYVISIEIKSILQHGVLLCVAGYQ